MSLGSQREQNTAKLVMNTFYKVPGKDTTGVTAEEITKYLQQRFGGVFRANTLTSKAEQALKRSAVLGYLERRGDRYVSNLTRELRCGRSRRRRRSRCRRRRRRRRRSCCCRRRKRRRRSSCGCK